MKIDMSKDTRVDTQEGAREEMKDDNMREEVRENSTKKDVKEDLREDNLINGLYAFLKKAMKGTDIQFRPLVRNVLFQSLTNKLLLFCSK